MVQFQHDHQAGDRQARSPRPRRRICLLKGCERPFDPPHPLSRYCSPACVQAARRHRCYLAARRYRASPGGKAKRKEQARRRRQRIREKQQENRQDAGGGEKPQREGHHKEDSSDFSSCHRPGCYEQFRPPRHGVLKKFCCALCRQALRRVLRRERLWKKRLKPSQAFALHAAAQRAPPSPI